MSKRKQKMPFRETKIIKFLLNNSSFIFLFLIIVIFSFVDEKFFTLFNFFNLLDLSSLLIMTSVAMALILQMGCIDLSLEGIVGLTSVVTGCFIKNLMTPFDIGFWAIFLSIGVGALFGFINGIIYTRLKIPSFMTTLGVNFITIGIGILITQGKYIILADTNLRLISTARVGFVPILLIIAIFVVLIFWFLTAKRAFGRHILAIGGDENLAKTAGIHVDRIKTITFTLAGGTYGLVGFLLTLRLGTGYVLGPYNYNFTTISACVLGGIAITGGVGNIFKAVIGVFIISILQNIMMLFNVSPYIQTGVMGSIIILTVALTIDRSKIKVLK